MLKFLKMLINLKKWCFIFKMLFLLWRSWQIAVDFIQRLFSPCSAGAWWLLEVGMVCAKGYQSGTVLPAICVHVSWRMLAKIREIL